MLGEQKLGPRASCWKGVKVGDVDDAAGCEMEVDGPELGHVGVDMAPLTVLRRDFDAVVGHPPTELTSVQMITPSGAKMRGSASGMKVKAIRATTIAQAT